MQTPRVIAWFALTLSLLDRSAHAQPARVETPAEAKAMADALFDGPFAIDDDKPESKLPSDAQRNSYPLEFGNFLMSMTEKGEEAYEAGDYQRAAKYFRGLVAAVPDRSVGFSRLCESYEKLGQREQAEAACGAALQRDGAKIEDYARYVHLVIARKGALDDKQLRHVDEATSYLRKTFPQSPIGAELQCQVALRLKDERRLTECTRTLQQLAPDAMSTISFSWLLAIMKLDRHAAETLVERARHAGADAETLRFMDQSTSGLISPFEKTLRDLSRPLEGALLVVGCAIIGLLFWRRQQGASLRKSNA